MPLSSILSTHTFRQLKFILPGFLVTYFLGTYNEFWRIAAGQAEGWGRSVALTSLGLGLSTVSLFLYVLLMPVIKGIQPNYRSWRDSRELASIIPLLTASIVFGWTLLTITLGSWSALGYLKGIVGSSGAYALVFGLMGLIPARKVHQQRS